MPLLPTPPPPPVAKLALKDFAGLVSNADPGDIEPGSGRFQVNVTAEQPGELKPRMGWARIYFRGD